MHATHVHTQVVSPYEINFLDSFTWRSLCKVELTEEDVS